VLALLIEGGVSSPETTLCSLWLHLRLEVVSTVLAADRLAAVGEHDILDVAAGARVDVIAGIREVLPSLGSGLMPCQEEIEG
jgi:hypothetical protein